MIAAVPIRQSNFNNNLRSTIGTYFGISRSVILIYSSVLELSESFFVLNREENLCDECHGLGYIRTLDKNRLINYDVPLEKNPIQCWNRYKDFYSQIIQQFCLDNGIDSQKTFRQLTNKEKTMILYGESAKKYSVRYKKNSSFSRRTTKYYGIMTGKPMMVNFVPATQFFSEETCRCCRGKKYSLQHERYNVVGLSIGDFMTMPFEQLQHHIKKMLSETTDSSLLFVLNNIQKFVSKAIDLHLGYLFFHRAIPTLSGGELQRLRMVQVLSTQLSNLLLVLDEPLAGLSGEEKRSVFECVVDLAKRHTVVIVDHSDIFVSVSKKIIALGESGGVHGGFIIDAKKYLAKQSIRNTINILPVQSMERVSIHNPVYSYVGVDIEIGKGCMNLITGHSGIGKSTLLREYFPQYFDHYLYINPKPLLGNKNSSVATALDVSIDISNLFAVKHKKDRRFFSNQTGCTGMCPVCMGAGYIEYGNGYDSKIRFLCKDCAGTGFNKILQKYRVAGKNIFDVWNMTIDETIEYFSGMNNKIIHYLEEANSLLLGHLRMGQPVATLSGGENIRVKVLKAMKSKAKVFGVDEPFKGLSNTEIFCVVQYLNRLCQKDRTVIVVDHSEAIEQYFAKHIELTCDNSILRDSNKYV
ncbi:hypothetical protein QCO44_06960 [Selenomonas sputigena]|uniref:UvrABC system protein A n=1 Tax=Selenomonas sputigena TaxID=69823 RepID=A0ABV3X5A8_9FIRM